MKASLKICLPLVGIMCGVISPAGMAQPKAPTEEPAISTDHEGTTVVGDRESPIGLYITPWLNAVPEKELDRPARYLEEQLVPIDADVFRRQLEYYNTITDHLRARSKPAAAKTP